MGGPAGRSPPSLMRDYRLENRVRSQVRALRGSCWLRPARRGRAAVIAMNRLERDRRCTAKSLEGRDHAEDLLIGEADRRLIDGWHRRRESGHDEGGGFVHRLGQVLDVAQPRDSVFRLSTDAPEVGEPERAALADRMAGQTDSFALHDFAADLDHVGRGHVASQRGLLRSLHFLLRHHLADVGIEPGRRDHKSADPEHERDPHDSSGAFVPRTPLHASAFAKATARPRRSGRAATFRDREGGRSRGPQGPAPLARLARCARSQQN